MNESVHYHHRPGKYLSEGYSCHGCDKQDSCTVMIKGAHYHHRSGIPPSDEKPPSKGYSYHGCDKQVSLQDSISGCSDQGDSCTVTIKSVHYHHRSGILSSDGYSCHGHGVQGSFQDCFSGCFDQGGEYAITKESVHYHQGSGIPQSDGYRCHGLDEQVSPQENIDQSCSPSSVSIIHSWVHVFSKSS